MYAQGLFPSSLHSFLHAFTDLPASNLNSFTMYIVVGQIEIQVKMIVTKFDSQFPLSSNPNYSCSMNN